MPLNPLNLYKIGATLPSGRAGRRGGGVIPLPFYEILFRLLFFYQSGVGFCWIPGAGFSPLVAGAHFPECFALVAWPAECLQIIKVVIATVGYVFDVVYFEVFGVAALYALVVVAVEGLLALFVGCAA
ncbi:hypothetical protein QPX53_11925 [Corynebacterium accolens]|nr:hypothetical protein [Corynebacterium accolens]MDK4338310.1 hypothetical protein [Corynebacterium accolens]